MNNAIASRTAARLVEPWDFYSRFPTPLPAALEAGLLGTAEVDEEQVAAIHEELELEVLGLLAELDRITEAMRHGLDPRTDKPPVTDARCEQVARMAESLPAVRDKAMEQALAGYMDAFGLDAGCAFRRFLIASHQHVVIYIPPTDHAPDLCVVPEQDTEARRGLLLADFERLMPGGEGTDWTTGHAAALRRLEKFIRSVTRNLKDGHSLLTIDEREPVSEGLNAGVEVQETQT